MRPLHPHRLAALASLALGLGACVFGFRGELDFANEASLSGLETVQLQLPPTQLVVIGEAARTYVDWEGTWVSLGGSGPDALDTAREAELAWESWDAVGRLSARLPVETRDITTLDHLDVESASYLAHEISGAGDVFVSGIDAYVSVELDGGNVEILGGTEQLRVWTARGDVDLSTAASVDVYSGAGRVHVAAEAGRDIVIDTFGSVELELADVANLDLDIQGAGVLVITLDSATHVGSGDYRRAIGVASDTVQIRSHGGRVELAMLASAAPEPEPPEP